MKRHLALIAVVCLSLSTVRAAEPVTLKVMTYNLAAGREAPLEELADYIREAQPDLVAVQELDRMTGRNGNEQKDFATFLGLRTGLFPLFGKTLDFMGGHYGIGILSRFPYANVTKKILPKAAQEEETRALLAAEIELSTGDTVLFVCTHIDYSTPETRMLQLGAVTEWLQQSPYPVLLGGDFNSLPDSPEVLTRMGAWLPLSGPEYTHPSHGPEPRIRIDYLYGYPPARWRLVSSQADDVRLSDHRPVVSTVELVR